MYDYGYGYDYGTADIGTAAGILGGMAAFMGIISLISLAISVISLVSQWIIYKKAGKKGWEAIIPIYNIVVLLEIVELPMWYIVLFFVPIANIYAIFKIYIELAHKFGKSTGFGVASVFFSFICLPILAFGKNNVYDGNSMNNNMQPETGQYAPNNNFDFQNQSNNIPNNMNTLNNQESNVYNQIASTPENSMTPPQMFDTNINNQVNSFNNNQEPLGPTTNGFSQPQNDMTTMNSPQQTFMQNQNLNQMNPQTSFVTPTSAIEQPVQQAQPQNTFGYGNQIMGETNNNQPQMGIPTMNTPTSQQQPFVQNQNPNNNPYNQNM